MKIIHCSDLHLDSKMEAHLSPQKARERKKEILLTFERMVEYDANNSVSGIIIAGDMFDTTRVSLTTKNRVLALIKNHENIEFFYLPGNHDEESIMLSLEDCPKNLKCFGKTWQSYPLENVVITGAQLGNSSLYELLKLDENKVNIVTLHGAVSTVLSKGKDVVDLVKLKNKFIDYLALGHYHFYSEKPLDKRGRYCYSGCLEGRGFDECGDRGFVLLDIENNKVSSQFVPFASRTLQIVEVDISGVNDFYDIEKKVSAELENVSEDCLVRVVLTGHYTLDLIKDIPLLERKLSSRFYYCEVQDDSRLKIEPKDYENDLSLKGDFIRQVMESNLSEDAKEKVIITGIKALLGEDVSL